MFFILSKTVALLFYPIIWIFAVFAFGLIQHARGKKTYAFILGFLMFAFFSNPYIVNVMMRNWEVQPVLMAEVAEHEVAVVLTGVTKSNKEPNDRVYFNKGADRLLHVVQLYKLGKVKKILISGGSGLLFGKKDIESENFRKVFLICGIKQADLLLEDSSRNTYENALYSAKIIKRDFKGKVLLVTSAFHMKRAARCFKKQGVNFTAFPVDYYSDEHSLTFEHFIPTENAMAHWRVLIKEYLGYLSYSMIGYI